MTTNLTSYTCHPKFDLDQEYHVIWAGKIMREQDFSADTAQTYIWIVDGLGKVAESFKREVYRRHMLWIDHVRQSKRSAVS